MFVRVKRVQSGDKTYEYLQLVANHRVGGKVKQTLIATLGRLPDLLDSGALDRLIEKLARHSARLRVLETRAGALPGNLAVESDRVWGPVLVFGRVWRELGLEDHLRRIGRKLRMAFDFERMVFAQVLQRLLDPGSDLKGSKWIRTVHEPAFERLRLEHFYRCLTPLWRHKNEIEERLYRRDLGLFDQELDLVFLDTTSIYFEGSALEGWAKLGKSKDHRPGHLQLVVSVVMRPSGLPISCEIWPGNTADVTTLQPIVGDLQKRFKIGRVILVTDRGFVSEANLEALTKAGHPYIVGVKMRKAPEVRDEVLGRAGRFREVDEHLRVKEVWVGDRRYVVCFNPQEAERDRAKREAILEKIEANLARGGIKALLNNRGYRRFLKVVKGSATIDPDRVAEDARYDGKYVLRTTSDLPAEEVAKAYKQLTRIERLWRELKSTLRVRPVYHHFERDNVRGHIFICFLALYVTGYLRQKLRAKGLEIPWDELVLDLSQLRAIVLRLSGRRYLMRSPLKGCTGRVLQALGIRPPALAEPL